VLKYIVTNVYPDAVEIWDQQTKDEKAEPAGHMVFWIKNSGLLAVGDFVTLHIRKVETVETDALYEQ